MQEIPNFCLSGIILMTCAYAHLIFIVISKCLFPMNMVLVSQNAQFLHVFCYLNKRGFVRKTAKQTLTVSEPYCRFANYSPIFGNNGVMHHAVHVCVHVKYMSLSRKTIFVK